MDDWVPETSGRDRKEFASLTHSFCYLLPATCHLLPATCYAEPKARLFYIVSAMIAFWAWSRFSAWSKTRLHWPSITSSATSMLRSAGRGCM